MKWGVDGFVVVNRLRVFLVKVLGVEICWFCYFRRELGGGLRFVSLFVS